MSSPTVIANRTCHHRLNEITHEINSAVEEQHRSTGCRESHGADARTSAAIHVRSTELARSSDQMSKMSRGLLEFMDRFTLEDSAGSRPCSVPMRLASVRRQAATAGVRAEVP